MRVVVIGGGVIGLLSAYYLRSRGYDVVVLEKNDTLGAEASAANANQLSYSLMFPPISTSVWQDLPDILFKHDSVIRFENLCDPSLLGWIMRAMPVISSRGVYESAAQKMALINQASCALMETFLERYKDLDFDRKPCGRLQLYEAEYDARRIYDAYQRCGYAGDVRLLKPSEIVHVEPSLEGKVSDFGAGLFFKDDEVGDCERFTQGLGEILSELGVDIRTGVSVNSLQKDGRSIGYITLASGEVIEADAFVVASGYSAKGLLASVGVHVPIYPVKGYTYEIPQEASFQTSVVDTRHKLVFTPLSGRCKVSSGVFFGMSDAPHEGFLGKMQENARALYPELEFDKAVLRSGYRPWAPNSLPIIKQSKYSNLYLNVGHGMLGWTMGHASGAALADDVKNGAFNEVRSF